MVQNQNKQQEMWVDRWHWTACDLDWLTLWEFKKKTIHDVSDLRDGDGVISLVHHMTDLKNSKREMYRYTNNNKIKIKTKTKERELRWKWKQRNDQKSETLTRTKPRQLL